MLPRHLNWDGVFSCDRVSWLTWREAVDERRWDGMIWDGKTYEYYGRESHPFEFDGEFVACFDR
jgi:hypothetical protein